MAIKTHATRVERTYETSNEQTKTKATFDCKKRKEKKKTNKQKKQQNFGVHKKQQGVKGAFIKTQIP